MLHITPLRRWLIANNMSIGSLARYLNVSRPRIQFWVAGATMPRGLLLDMLMLRTGLTVRQLVPDPNLQAIRRVREHARRERLGLNRTSKTWGKPQRQPAAKAKGKATRHGRTKRAARR